MVLWCDKAILMPCTFLLYVWLTVSTCFCSVPVTSAAVKVATPATSPFTQRQVQHQVQQQQQLHKQQQVQQQLQQQHQHQLQFLANALQLQSQLNAQTQMRPATPATGQSISALDSYHDWFFPLQVVSDFGQLHKASHCMQCVCPWRHLFVMQFLHLC